MRKGKSKKKTAKDEEVSDEQSLRHWLVKEAKTCLLIVQMAIHSNLNSDFSILHNFANVRHYEPFALAAPGFASKGEPTEDVATSLGGSWSSVTVCSRASLAAGGLSSFLPSCS